MALEGYRLMALKVALLTVLVGVSSAQSLLAETAPLLSYRKSPTTGQAVPQTAAQAGQALRPPMLHTDPAVQQAAHTSQATPLPATTPPRDPRRLARPRPTTTKESSQGSPAAESAATSISFPQLKSFTSAGAGLGIVVGLFLLCMWLLRRSGPRPTAPLPREAVAVLGRVPLAAQHFAHLIQVGRKLVLVSVTPEGVSPITEVSDPLEVDRLLGLCLHNGNNSETAQFQQVLQQLAQEPAQGFLGNEGQATGKS